MLKGLQVGGELAHRGKGIQPEEGGKRGEKKSARAFARKTRRLIFTRKSDQTDDAIEGPTGTHPARLRSEEMDVIG